MHKSLSWNIYSILKSKMKIKVKRFAIEIIPESEEDTAYIEEVLKLRLQGDNCRCIRQNMPGSLSIGCIEICSNKRPQKGLV